METALTVARRRPARKRERADMELRIESLRQRLKRWVWQAGAAGFVLMAGWEYYTERSLSWGAVARIAIEVVVYSTLAGLLDHLVAVTLRRVVGRGDEELPREQGSKPGGEQ
jgi:hypothetical protein